MKKKLFITLSVFLFSLVSYSQEKDKSLARAQKTQGVYLFIECEPLAEYEVMGRVKSSVNWFSEQYDAVKSKLVKKALKDYPDADGIMIDFCKGCADNATVIKFVKKE